MRFGVLGPLTVWAEDGEQVTVPGVKVRTLLADLLVHEGRPVTADRLVEDLWRGRPPGNPAGALQVKVSQLRQALERAEPRSRQLVVSTSSSGYLLRTEADAVDAGRFAALTERARAIDDYRAKAALLTDALALWRGPAFADFVDEPFAQAMITRLEEQRLVALEDQAEARLALGEHRLLAGELDDLVTRYPHRERLRATQLRALYRAGRQSEALAGYDELRDRLAEELGLDPSPELVALHQAILRQDPALDAVAAPATSATRPRTNLPAPLTDLIGRADAVSRVRSMLESERLVTLTGSGGVGKTRLAVATASQLAETLPDGVWLVELAALGPPDDQDGLSSLVEAVMTVLGIREDAAANLLPPGQPNLVDRLVGAIRAKQLLLMLDNCEHVVEQVAKLAELLLRAVPALRILATSQEPLGLAGEVLWTVPPLDLPDPMSGAKPEVLVQSSAVQLFVTRAAAAAPGFALDEDNAHAVAVLCRRLDGIPLALELAATRVRALGVHGLVARLDDRFRLLATGYRGAPPRQQTLRAVIDWSWELLSQPERTVLRRLAVHAESCALEAVESVCAGDDVVAEDVLDLLVRLVDRCLVVVVHSADGPRYRLLESVAEYCLGRLREAGEYERVRQRHHAYYTELAERARPHLHGHAQRRWLERLDVEAANLRSALDGAVRDRQLCGALRLVNAMAWYWFLRGRLREARRSLDMALGVDGVDGPESVAARAEATTWQAGIALLEGDRTDQARSEAALQMYLNIDDPVGLARAQWFLGFALYIVGELSASETLMNRALAGFRAIGDTWGVAATLSVRADQALLRGDLTAIKDDGEQSAMLFRELGDQWGQLQTISPLGSLAEITSDYELATRLHREGLRMAEELGLWTEAAERLTGLGRIALLVGDYAEAQKFHERAMRLSAEQGYKPGEIHAEIGLGLGARREGKLDLAETHLRNVFEWHLQVDFAPGNALILAELGFIAEHRGDAEATLAVQLEGFDVARTVGDPRALALALEGLAGAQALGGRHGEAAVLLGAAAAARQSVGAPLPSAERGDVDRITAVARQALGDEVFAAEFHRGGRLAPDQARAVIAR